VTGLSIVREPHWQDMPLGSRYSASFAVIGGRILYSAPRGNAGNWGVPRFMEMREKVLREAGLWREPHVEIKDYGEVPEDHPRFGRVQFTLAMAAEDRRGHLKGFYAFNGPASFGRILRVAKRLVRHRGIPADFVPDYEAAVLHAVDRLGQLDLRVSSAWQHELLSRDAWSLDLHGLYARAGVIGRDILYAELRGKLQVRQVDRVHRLGQLALTEPGRFPDGQAYRVFNLAQLEGVSWRARRRWLALVREQQARVSCPLVVMVGASRILGAAARMSRPIFTGPVALAVDMDHALELILDHRVNSAMARRRERDGWRVPRVFSEEQVRKQSDDLLDYVGAINWDLPGLEQPPCGPEHPLHGLYEAVAVIKHDFDAMVKEREEMQARVYRAAKVASLGTLAAGFAHELNNPLTAVLGFAQRIQEVSQEEKSRKFAAVIERAARRMSGVVSKLGEYSRESDAVAVTPTDLNEAVERVMELLGPVLKRQRVAVTLDLEQGLPPVLADPGHLQSVVQNLLTNARDALVAAGQSNSGNIKIRSWSSPGWSMLAVEDDGPGMPEEVMEQAFDPFFTTKEVGKGTGLGLYVVHRIVDQYNGNLTLQSDAEQGTRVEIQFPSQEDRP